MILRTNETTIFGLIKPMLQTNELFPQKLEYCFLLVGIRRHQPFNRQPHKMVKHTQKNLPKNCLSVFDHFVGLALKGLSRPQKTYGTISEKRLSQMEDGRMYICGESNIPGHFCLKKNAAMFFYVLSKFHEVFRTFCLKAELLVKVVLYFHVTTADFVTTTDFIGPKWYV